MYIRGMHTHTHIHILQAFTMVVKSMFSIMTAVWGKGDLEISTSQLEVISCVYVCLCVHIGVCICVCYVRACVCVCVCVCAVHVHACACVFVGVCMLARTLARECECTLSER